MYWSDFKGDKQLKVDIRFSYQEIDGFELAISTLDKVEMVKIGVDVPGESSFVCMKLEHLDILEEMIKCVKKKKGL